jgi:HSP20 family molecular chaperone IbpA
MDTIVDLAPMRRSSIGFDHFFSVLDHAIKARDRVAYPPYNIEKTDEDAYRLTVAVAGWVTGGNHGDRSAASACRFRPEAGGGR